MQEKIRLADCKSMDFIGGQIITRVEVDEEKGESGIGKIKTIPPKSICLGKIIHEDLYDLEYKVQIDENKITREGDIVVKLSTPYDAAYVTQEDEGLLITSFCVIIRIRDRSKIDPKFLNAFINSGVYIDQIGKLVSGSRVPMLTITKIKEVSMNNLSLEHQKEIGRYYENICRKEEIMKQIIVLEKEKIDSILVGEQR